MAYGQNYDDAGDYGGPDPNDVYNDPGDGRVWDAGSQSWIWPTAAAQGPAPATDPGAAPSPQETGGTGGTGETGGNATIGGLLAPYTGNFQAPANPYPGATGTGVPNTPVFNAPRYEKPPAFSYEAFKGPSYAEARDDPGFQFGLGQSLQALQQRAASRGSLNTGGTIKGLIDYARSAADQQYGDVYGRQLQGYQTNRNNAADIYATNAATQYQMPYEAAYRSAVDSFAPQMQAYSTNAQANQRGNENAYTNSWNQYLQNYDQFKDQRDSTFGKLFSYLTA